MAPYQWPAGIQPRSFASPGTTVDYPHVYGLVSRAAELLVNSAILQALNEMRQEQTKMQSGAPQEMTGHFEIKTNERGILSLMLTNYAYSVHMAHGFTIAKSLTFDLSSGKPYPLPSLFRPGSDYVSLLSAQVEAQIKKRSLPLLGEFKGIRPNQDYYLADKSLVLYFQLYEITPYYVGFPMFPISVYELAPIAAEHGPLETLAADIA